MAKTTCLSCGAEMGFFNSKVQVSDGFICMECWMLAGYKNDMKSLMEARNYTASQVKSMKETFLNDTRKAIHTIADIVPTATIANTMFDDVSEYIAIRTPPACGQIQSNRIV